MPANGLTTTADIQVRAREIDFVTRFARNWDHLRAILGIARPVKKQPGVVLKSKRATVQLESGDVGEGEEIPYSKASVTEIPYKEMKIRKYQKGVTMEEIAAHGYDVAIGMTDDAFLFELQDVVTGDFYDYLNSGTLTHNESTFQRAFAMAKGLVINKFKEMHRTVTGVVGFANVLDLYDYLGGAEITVQNAFGFQYIKNFMGYDTVILLSDNEIPRGRVTATPVDNIVLYYIDPSDSDFAKADLRFTTDGVTDLIGLNIRGNYGKVVSESTAIMGMVLFAEYIDGIAIVDVSTISGSVGTLSVSSAAGSDSGTTAVTVTEALGSGHTYKYKVSDTPVHVTNGQNVRAWKAWDGSADIKANSGQFITIVEADDKHKAVKTGSATVTSA